MPAPGRRPRTHRDPRPRPEDQPPPDAHSPPRRTNRERPTPRRTDQPPDPPRHPPGRPPGPAQDQAEPGTGGRDAGHARKTRRVSAGMRPTQPGRTPPGASNPAWPAARPTGPTCALSGPGRVGGRASAEGARRKAGKIPIQASPFRIPEWPRPQNPDRGQ